VHEVILHPFMEFLSQIDHILHRNQTSYSFCGDFLQLRDSEVAIYFDIRSMQKTLSGMIRISKIIRLLLDIMRQASMSVMTTHVMSYILCKCYSMVFSCETILSTNGVESCARIYKMDVICIGYHVLVSRPAISNFN